MPTAKTPRAKVQKPAAQADLLPGVELTGSAPAKLKNSLPSDPHQVAIDDLYEEAKTWLTGDPIKSEAEEQAVDTLLDLTRKAVKAADDDRKIEVKPHDEARDKVQARYKPILDRGKTIVDACKDLLTPWREKVTAAKAEAARKTQLIADQQTADAQAALQNAGGNVLARTEAIAKLDAAKDFSKHAARLERDADSGTGLRRTFEPQLTDLKVAIGHYYRTHPGALSACIMDLARSDVNRGLRDQPDKPSIPGMKIVEVRKAV